LHLGLKQQLQTFFGYPIVAIRSVTGGDINKAYVVEIQDSPTPSCFFVKSNDLPIASALFRTEALGLAELSQQSEIRIPKVIANINYNNGAALIMEYLAPATNFHDKDWEAFGKGLAALHQICNAQFGLAHSNFIGTIQQENQLTNSWYDFYVNQRLRPQIRLASETNLLNNQDQKLFSSFLLQLKSELPEEQPHLLHGDLWNGNFLWTTSGQAAIFDPAVYFGHREVDLAMTRLFGGFSPTFYESYQSAFPLMEGWERRIRLYQLYYLLVHLNLFGGSYYRSVMDIVEDYQ